MFGPISGMDDMMGKCFRLVDVRKLLGTAKVLGQISLI